MRFVIWTWRVILTVVIGAFVATVYYMTHDVGTHMDVALPALNLITVIGTALLGIVWASTRRYWYAFILLVVLGITRGLFGFPSATEPKLLTHFQSIYLWASIGVVGLSLVVALTARALIADRTVKATTQAGTVQTPAQTTKPILAPAAGKESETREPAG